METAVIYEIIGYIASILIAISLMMSNILRLRVINLVGSLFFTVYGLLIQAYPVAAVNFFIVLIDLYYLYEMLSAKEYFRLLEVQPDSEYLRFFLNHYEQDIQKFQPGFRFAPQAEQLVFFALRNLVPAGLVIGEINDDGRLHILLDYVIPGYRDLKIGNFIFTGHTQIFRQHGIRKIYALPGNSTHDRYLHKMGFEPETTSDGEKRYCLSLSD